MGGACPTSGHMMRRTACQYGGVHRGDRQGGACEAASGEWRAAGGRTAGGRRVAGLLLAMLSIFSTLSSQAFS